MRVDLFPFYAFLGVGWITSPHPRLPDHQRNCRHDYRCVWKPFDERYPAGGWPVMRCSVCGREKGQVMP